MKMRPLSKRENFILYITLGIFVSALIFNFLIRPMVVKLNRINQDIEKKKALLKRYSRLINKGEDFLSLYGSYKEHLATKSDSEEVVTVLWKEIKGAAESFKLAIERIKPLPVGVKNGHKQVSLEIELAGNLSPIFQFINHLENSDSFIRVSSLRIFPQSGSSSQLYCRITLSKLFF